MLLKNKLILASFLVFGFSIKGMEKGKIKSRPRVASTAQEWEFLYHVFANIGEHVKCLIRKGVDIHVENHGGLNALEIAIYNDLSEIIKILVKNGAVIDEKYLRQAIFRGCTRSAKTLIKLGADVNYDKNGMSESILIRTVWESFENKKLLRIIPLLVQKGADLNATSFGKTAYDYAYEHMGEGNEWDSEILELIKP